MPKSGKAIGRRRLLKATAAANSISMRPKCRMRPSARQLRKPINDMPPYPEDFLSDKDVADIYAFWRALPGRRPVKDIPLPNN